MIRIIGKKNCAKCTMVKELLSKRNIEFTYITLDDWVEEYPEQSQRILDDIYKRNDGRYPIIYKDGNIVSLKDVL